VRRLEGPELEAYDLIDRELAERVRIIRVPFLAPGTSGMTLGRFVLLTSDTERSGNRTLLAHELVHVRQWAEQGRWGFLSTYLRSYFRELAARRSHRDAYLAIPAEQEAYAAASAWAERRPGS
jgi:Domain of unknown function (DUF4157)